VTFEAGMDGVDVRGRWMNDWQKD